MKYNKLVAEFCRANEERKTIEGYIVFSPDSFEKPYPLQARTYLVSSDNKAFKSGMSGNSIFGSALDGSDNGVRLDLYMKDAGNPDGWVVEDCGLVAYELIGTFERKTEVLGIYPCHKDASHAMRESFMRAVNTPDDIQTYLSENEGDFSSDSAWANDAGPEDGNCDWNIVRLFNNGRLLLNESSMNEPKEA